MGIDVETGRINESGRLVSKQISFGNGPEVFRQKPLRSLHRNSQFTDHYGQLK